MLANTEKARTDNVSPSQNRLGTAPVSRPSAARQLGYLLLFAAAMSLAGCSVFSSSADWRLPGMPEGGLPWEARDIGYNNLPKIRHYLQPQSGMVVCRDQQAAIAMALTGFFIESCATLTKPDHWQVQQLTFKDMGEGRTLWLVEVHARGEAEEDKAGQTGKHDEENTAWAPLPWHDWI